MKTLFNKKVFFFSIGLMIFCVNSPSQNLRLIDSLKTELNTNKEEKIKAAILNQLAREYIKSNPDSSFVFAKQALKLSKKYTLKEQEAMSLYNVGTYYKSQNQLDSAMNLAKKALTIAQQIDFNSGIIKSCHLIGNTHIKRKEYKEAFTFLLKSKDIALKANDQLGLAESYTNLGIYYIKKSDYNKAQQYYMHSLKAYESINDMQGVAYCYVNIGNVYFYQDNYQKAKEHYIQGLSLHQKLGNRRSSAHTLTNIGNVYYYLDSLNKAIAYYEKSLPEYKFLNDQIGVFDVTNNIGVMYEGLGEYNKALDQYHLAIKAIEDLNDIERISNSYNNIGVIHEQLNEIDKAEEFYLKCLELSKTIEDNEQIKTTYDNLAFLHFRAKKYKSAFEYYEQFSIMKDSIFNESKAEQMAEMREKYETVEKEKKIVLLEKDQQLTDAELNQKTTERNAFITGFGLLLLLSVVGVRGYRNKIKGNALIATKNEEINKQKINDLLNEHEFKLVNTLIEGQDGERERIAKDLHGRLGVKLSALKQHFNAVEETLEGIDKKDKTQYEKANLLLEEAMSESREIAHNLFSVVLTNFGLIRALNDLKDTIESSNRLKMNVLANGIEGRLDKEIELNVYRIIQELLSNILNHAQASEVTIQLNIHEDVLNVMVEDDGIGFDSKSDSNKKGMGMNNIETRVNNLKGEFNIDSVLGRGTTSIIDIPISNPS